MVLYTCRPFRALCFASSMNAHLDNAASFLFLHATHSYDVLPIVFWMKFDLLVTIMGICWDSTVVIYFSPLSDRCTLYLKAICACSWMFEWFLWPSWVTLTVTETAQTVPSHEGTLGTEVGFQIANCALQIDTRSVRYKNTWHQVILQGVVAHRRSCS